jgi:hypothetical protein
MAISRKGSRLLKELIQHDVKNHTLTIMESADKPGQTQIDLTTVKLFLLMHKNHPPEED